MYWFQPDLWDWGVVGVLPQKTFLLHFKVNCIRQNCIQFYTIVNNHKHTHVTPKSHGKWGNGLVNNTKSTMIHWTYIYIYIYNYTGERMLCSSNDQKHNVRYLLCYLKSRNQSVIIWKHCFMLWVFVQTLSGGMAGHRKEKVRLHNKTEEADRICGLSIFDFSLIHGLHITWSSGKCLCS